MADPAETLAPAGIPASGDDRAQAEAGLRWISARLDRFLPRTENRASSDRSRIKPLAELAMVHAYTTLWSTRLDWPVLTAELVRWRDFLTSAEVGERLRDLIRADPGNGLYLVQPYAWSRSAGHRDRQMEEAVRRLWQARAEPGSWGVVHCLWRAGYIRRAPDWATSFRRHVLGRTRDAAEVRRDAYRITHAIFYLTDLGDLPVPLKSEELTELEPLLIRIGDDAYLHGRWDLLNEVLISLNCLSAPLPDDWRTELDAHRGSDGGVPHDSGPVAPHGDFAWCYHATLVDLLRRVQCEAGPGAGGRA